jgi:hypothetical protein
MKRCLTVFLAAAALTAPAFADGKKSTKDDEDEFPKWETVVKDHEAQEGFLKLYRKEKEQKLLAAVPEDLLEQPFFLATSIAGGSDYAGWQWQDKLLQFERFGKKLLIVELNTQQRADEEKPVAEVVRRTYADRLLASVDIEAKSEDDELLFDLGELLGNDYRTFFGSLFSLDSSLARFQKAKAFPNNLEVTVQMPRYGDGTFVTIHYSISRLPKLEDYTPRMADDRIGYFLTAIRDYSKGDPREGRMVRLINRWKLEKADPDLPLSPPKEPIVFYVEKTVPIAYRRAVAEGILEWNRAFEQVGIVGAIDVRQQTDTQFADLDPEDVRYNFFRWITSETPFAMGPSRVDPRTGRILDADIIFDDSMLRGYMRDYDALLRDGPEKLLTRSMLTELERRPERHPLARLKAQAGQGAAETRAQRLLQELAKTPEGRTLLARGEGEQPAVEEPRLQHASVCQVGQFLPHKVGLLRLAMGDLAREGATAPTGGAFADYLSEIVKETVMHEVGHTIGLRHNFSASSLYDLKTINSPARPKAISASVMDYHPVNLVPGGADRPRGHYLSQTLGPYDMLAIEYGYKLCKEDDEELAKVPGKIAEQGIPYATDEDTRAPDPHIARWDLGKDPLAFADLRLALVKELWGELETRTVADGDSYAKLRRALNITLFEVQTSSLFVARTVGGLEFHRDHKGDPNARPPISVIQAKRQRAALQWICKNVFAEDALPVPAELQSKLAAGRWVHWGSPDTMASLEYSLMDRILAIQTWALFFLTSDDVLARTWENEQRVTDKGADVLTLPELFDTLEAAIFSELIGGPPAQGTVRNPTVSSRRQQLQDAYVQQLISIALAKDTAPPVASKLAWARLAGLEERLKGGVRAKLDPYSAAHLDVLASRSQAARTARYVHVASGVSGCALAPDASEAPATGAGLLVLLLAGLGLRRRRAAAAAV